MLHIQNSTAQRSILNGLLLLVVLGLMPGLVSAEEPFAPKVELPKNLENRDMWINMIEAWKIPGKSEVEIPAYPGAVIVAFMEAGKMTANDVEFDTLPVIMLATADEPAQVLAFYTDKLADWKHKDSFGIADVFWKGTDDFDSMDITVSSTNPNVMIMKPLAAQTDFYPDAKATISIVYNPAK